MWAMQGLAKHYRGDMWLNLMQTKREGRLLGIQWRALRCWIWPLGVEGPMHVRKSESGVSV
tara:strand:- start:2848 stop:3030 length:183 start_codon:yes stop_codon:yes gene_type:complete